MKEFGAALKQAREESGITLETIHDRTRINLKHLRAIENGDFPSVPPTYVRAFIREYARMVGLDDDATVAEYNRLAEELKGIPRPPDAIDHSHLTPQMDDSVEIVESVPAGTTPPRHVEVEGTMEVEEEDFSPPVRRSAYVSDDHKSVDLPASSRKSTTPPDDSQDDTAPATPEQKSEAPGSPPTDKPDKNTPGAPDKKIPSPPAASSRQPEKPAGETRKKKIVLPKKGDKKPAESKQQKPDTSGPTSATRPKPPADKPAEKQSPGKEKQSLKERLAAGKESIRKKASPESTSAPKEQKPAKPPVKRTPEDEEQRRLIIIGSLITLAIIIGIYGIVYFSEDTTPSTAVADSTRTQPDIYAERFIDSTDFIPDEPEIIPDTTTGTVPTQAAGQAGTENAYASEDSLILEAFSSTPVYFSIRMDTTKTEKGFLSKNEHRVWKAKDRFVISLGDAGAMTFFLNGKQLKSLGGEGLAINNYVINRKSIDQE